MERERKTKKEKEMSAEVKLWRGIVPEWDSAKALGEDEGKEQAAETERDKGADAPARILTRTGL